MIGSVTLAIADVELRVRRIQQGQRAKLRRGRHTRKPRSVLKYAKPLLARRSA